MPCNVKSQCEVAPGFDKTQSTRHTKAQACPSAEQKPGGFVDFAEPAYYFC